MQAPRELEFRKERITSREDKHRQKKNGRAREGKNRRENRRIKYPLYFHGTLP